MSNWERCYRVPKQLSCKPFNHVVEVMFENGMIINMTKAEFERDYTLRAPAPGEYRDDLRKREAEIERLRARIAALEDVLWALTTYR